MLFIILLSIIKAQIYTHTFLVLDSSPTIGLPNHLNRQIIDTKINNFPNLDDKNIKKSILSSNFSIYMQDVKFTYGKSKISAEVTYSANQAIVVYYQYQNLQSIIEIKQQYEELKQFYLTDQFFILIQNKVDKQVTENIIYSTNPTKFIADYSQKLVFQEKNYSLNIIQETNRLIQNKSQCDTYSEYLKIIRNYDQYTLMVDRFSQMQQIQQWTDSWLELNNTDFAQLLFDQQMSQTQQLLDQFETFCEEQSQLFSFNFENYQCSMIAVFMIIFVLIQHFVKVMNMSDKDKYV